MKAKSITYSRLVSTGNFQNEKIEITLELEEGDKAADVFAAAKAFVDKRASIAKLPDYVVEQAQKVLQDRRNHTIAQIEEAELILAKKSTLDEDLPF